MIKCGQQKLKFFYKSLLFITIICSILLLPVSSFAQDLACGGEDPLLQNCPLDTWVWVLAFIAASFGALQIYRRQKIQAGV